MLKPQHPVGGIHRKNQRVMLQKRGFFVLFFLNLFMENFKWGTKAFNRTRDNSLCSIKHDQRVPCLLSKSKFNWKYQLQPEIFPCHACVPSSSPNPGVPSSHCPLTPGLHSGAGIDPLTGGQPQAPLFFLSLCSPPLAWKNKWSNHCREQQALYQLRIVKSDFSISALWVFWVFLDPSLKEKWEITSRRYRNLWHAYICVCAYIYIYL